ncbi:hypothetical protein E2C01_034056 [Portunus trituberculatus]|uniref:Uncharacterized protein n=1 Tax=Portunus trituberculatus TaxID=210409 RepID=A0A5B7F536_PORTR|nr:hypothetical protein [Portunus trituberculatus]
MWVLLLSLKSAGAWQRGISHVTDVIARNIPSLTADDRKKFRSILNGMKLKPSGFFDVSSQDLTEAMDSDVDELLQDETDLLEECGGEKLRSQ